MSRFSATLVRALAVVFTFASVMKRLGAAGGFAR
jgi:hypothetical protein